MTLSDHEHLKDVLSGVGGSKIVYSLVMPETEAVKRRVFGGDQKKAFQAVLDAAGGLPVDADALMKASERASVEYYNHFREGWTQKQDAMHERFFDRWFDWASPIAEVSKEDFSFRYPIAGGSEGLRTMADEYGARARRDKFEPQIHMFDGDYEGFSAYADAAYIPVIKHNRGNWQAAVEKIAQASKNKPVQIYLSQPSALDGNVWKDYDPFMQALAKQAPNAEVMLDLTYVGCITKESKIRTDYPNIPAIVFSLSKPAGVYYDRIGGVVAKAKPDQDHRGPYPALFGTIWMKNLSSLLIGEAFMNAHGVYELPRKYAPIQQKALDQITENLKSQGHEVALKPSDVFLLATGEMPADPKDIHHYLKRPCDGRDIIRACLTPTMGEMIGMAQTHTVTPRYYERG